MKRRAGLLAIIISWPVAWHLQAQEIHLKTRTIQSDSPAPAAASQPGAHLIVQFDHFPSAEDLGALLADGNTVTGVLPDNAVVVASQGGHVTPRAGLRWVGGLDPADKLSPALGTAEPITAVVEFHSDVSTGVQDAVAAAEGVTLLRPSALVANHAIVTGSLADLNALAAHDEVAYIFPADPGLLAESGLYPCAGMLTTAGPIAQYANIVHGWDLDTDNAAHLGYVFASLTTKVPAAEVESEIVRALNAWSQVTNVIFQPGTFASAPRTVLVKFASGAHGDAYPFEANGGILAHTFYPVPVNAESIAGDIHLNADENWHDGGDVDIYSVALHEVGHAIGLGHTDNPGDVMYPYYRRGMSLSANDIGAARQLYGVPASAPAAPITAPAPAPSAPAPLPALNLTLDSAPASTPSPQASLSGTVSGGVPPISVQWQTDHGYSGPATMVSAGAWSAPAIALVNGSNTITVTAFDSAHQTATRTASIALVPPATPAPGPASPGGAGGPVAVAITSPVGTMISVNTTSISLAGTASGGVGIARVTWQTSAGATGTASGTTHWLATAIPLLTGNNTILVRAYDSNGANAWTSLVAIKH